MSKYLISQLKSKYQGQALLVILTILIVAAIIALAIVSRVRSDQVNVTQERTSNQASTVASEVINTVSFEPVTEIATVVNSVPSDCNGDEIESYDLLENGCYLDSYDKVIRFLDLVGDTLGNDGFGIVADQISDELNDSCGDDQNITLTIKPVEENELFTIADGSTVSLINNGIEASDPACTVHVEANTSAAGSTAGIVERATYTNDTQGFKAYDYSDVNAYCLFDCTGNPKWQGINDGTTTNGWEVSTGGASIARAVKVTDGGNDYFMDELRLLAVSGDLTASYSTAPQGCADVGTMMKVTTIVTCGGTSQGKEVLLPKDSWAPAIFDYVLYNGSGTLEYRAN